MMAATESANHWFELVVSPQGHLLEHIAQLCPSSVPPSSQAASCLQVQLGWRLLELEARALPLGQWAMVALTVDQQHATLYIDSVTA